MQEKKFLINNKTVCVYDNVLTHPETVEIYQEISQLPYIRSNLDDNFSNNLDIDIKWSCLIESNSHTFKMLSLKYNMLPNIFINKCQILRQYVNYSTSETVDKIHTDTYSYVKNALTIIYYANTHWNKNWHGETVFYNDIENEILLSIMIKPGRIVVFDSTIPHCARPPSKIAKYPRYTIATKILLNEHEQ